MSALLAEVSLGWTAQRAAGIGALLTSSGAVVLGVLAAAPALSRGRLGAFPRKDLRPLHEAASIATMVAIALHVLLFVVDGFVTPGIVGALVPFASPTMPLAVGLGQVAAYGMVALGLSYYARGRIGPARWKRAHRFVAGFWLLAVVHTVTAGSDAGRLWFLAIALAPAVLAAGLLALRWWPRSEPVSAARAGRAG